jgi:archaetidylinositol phosphate synthase
MPVPWTDSPKSKDRALQHSVRHHHPDGDRILKRVHHGIQAKQLCDLCNFVALRIQVGHPMAQTSMPQRSNDGLLQPLERPALLWLAQRMPAWVTPNFLTGIGFIGACITAAGYACSRWQLAFLWLATLGLLINWFGDSLDGTLARVRRIERPRYGFFLDQNLDAFEQMIFAVGVGFSGFIHFELAMFTLAAYFLMSILTLVRAVVSKLFALTYLGIGLTELRVTFSILNVVMFFFPPKPFPIAGLWLTYPELLMTAWAASMIIAFLMSVKAQLPDLTAEDQISGRK